MSSEHVNGLAKAASAYLRSAMHQPVDWQEWGPEAFARAGSEDKPILLDIGAVWCHWCHVMDRESYEDPLTARIINDHYIAVKVDRDERPDVDARYQAAVASISGQGGWPLTAFLTPEGLPYFGGTYFPPQDQHGRPSMQRVLLTMAEAFQKRRGEVNESAGSVMAAIEDSETFNAPVRDPGTELIGKLIASAVQQFDARNGGFGGQPKFPHPAAIDMLLDAAARGDSKARDAALVTLEKMAKGGIYDHLAGGFHRYSVDERWVVPHFEKMAYDNAGLLLNYVHAYQSFASPECARVARETIAWMDACLSDRDHGGFYASQDADFSLDDDGDYFTWTKAESAAVLSREEMAIAAPYFDIGELGDMHHNPQKNVLHILQPLATVAKSARVSEAEAVELLAAAKRKLYAARLQRPTPFIDKTIYTAWNSMCVSAYIAAARVVGIPDALKLALKSLNHALASAWTDDEYGAMAHVIAYSDGAQRVSRIAGVLDDYAFTGLAALDAWEATGNIGYYTAAAKITAGMIARFYDREAGGFFDTESLPPGETRLGALGTRRKPLQDSPTPAGNSAAATLLLRIEALSGDREYGSKAKRTLEHFAGVVEHLGLYAGSYALALRRMVQPPVQVCVVGDDAFAEELESAALARFVVNKSVVRLRRDQLASLPPALAETLPNVPDHGKSFALVCAGNTCLPSVSNLDGLVAALSSAT